MVAEILTISVAAMPVVAEIFGLGTAFIERKKPAPVTNIYTVAQPASPMRIELVEPVEPAPVPLVPLIEETP